MQKKLKPANYKAPLAYAVSWLIITTLLLTLPGSAFPKENWLDKIGFDKWVHLGLFAIMIFLWCWLASQLLHGSKKLLPFFLLITLFFSGYGIAMEYVQENLVSNRSFDTGDIYADIAGCVLGFGYSYWRYIKK